MLHIITKRVLTIVLIASLFAAGFFFGKHHVIVSSEIEISGSTAILILDGNAYEYVLDRTGF